MSKKILVISTIECAGVNNTIFDYLNNREDRIKMEACYDKIDLHSIAEEVFVPSFNEYISKTTSFDSALNEVFNVSTYAPFISEFTSQEFTNTKVFAPISHLLEKPPGIDMIIGYAVPEELFGVDHLQEHESIEESNAKKIMLAHNEILRSNADKFDVFIDGDSLDAAIKKMLDL